ncbi:MAG: hypothetical protein IT537_03355 [Hyphomicrobiales bacterium]|nr:hypothetical protein [Hyphomicrobiales bacterium]
MSQTMLRCRPDNPGCWLAVMAIARLAAKSGTLVLPRWRQDGAELALSSVRTRKTIEAVKKAALEADESRAAPWGAAGPITVEIAGSLVCLDWHCKAERKITGGSQLRLLSGHVTVMRQLASCAALVTADRLERDDWFDGAPDDGTWLFDATGAWDRATLGYSPDAIGVAVAGNAVTELLAMVGAAVAPWRIDGNHFRYAIDGQPMWAPFIARGKLRALGWARPERPEEAPDEQPERYGGEMVVRGRAGGAGAP